MASTFILGAGVTGLAAGIASGLPVFEASPIPGGICSSYYVRPGESTRLPTPPAGDNAYRFEIGGGHWIFGGDPAILRFINSLTPARTYSRISGVFFPDSGKYVPYPLQNHLRFLAPDIAARAIEEMSGPAAPFTTMHQWLESSFGPTLAHLFFLPFHELYTAGLHNRIAPQDAYKSPVDLKLVRQGAAADAPAVGYNTRYIYPAEGLGTLAHRMADRADVRFGRRAVSIDPRSRAVQFQDGSSESYTELLSTLPLNKMMEMTGLQVDVPADPYTSVLVLNIGARKGPRCPKDHWLYIPRSSAGFHRVGFYSNVDPSFLPGGSRSRNDRVSIYVERAYVGGSRPSAADVQSYSAATVTELQRWGFIGEVEVSDPTWIDVAYTWSWPNSPWRARAMKLLEQHSIYPVGRYARWVFQGIADSIRDGFLVGASFKPA